MKLPGLLLLLLIHAVVVLGGVYLMLSAFGDALESELDAQVERVEDDLERNFRRVEDVVRRELDARLPTPVPAP